MIEFCRYENKCEFFFEVIPALILSQRIDILALIFEKYYQDIFEINSYNKLTHQGLFQIAFTLVLIRKGELKQAKKEIEGIYYSLVFDSYSDYIGLFYQIAKYQLTKEKKDVLSAYKLLVRKVNLKKFDKNLIVNFV